MDDAGQASRFSAPDDIPEAIRESPSATASLRPKQNRRKWLLIGAAVAGISIVTTGIAQLRAGTQPDRQTVVAVAPDVMRQAMAALGEDVNDNTPLLGHLPYEEAPAAELEPLPEDGSIKLRKAAAEKFDQMVEAAKAEGVHIRPVSGFRSVADQQKVFFEVKAERAQNPMQRAEVSAPPGYSEHHTGYAIDLGDADRSGTDLNPDFDQTPAFQWLKDNAARYSFELSFPKDNPQGVSYEPWHWRFVGDRTSLETFYRARVGAVKR